MKRKSRRQKVGPCYPALPCPIYCWLCGNTLESPTWDSECIPGFAFENEDWYQAWCKYSDTPRARRRKLSLYMEKSDLDRPLKVDGIWEIMFRIIVSSRGEKYLPKGHHLSGIGYLPGARTMEGKYILAPRDPNVACIGGMRENSEALKVCPVPHIFSYLTQCENNLEGLIIHSRCWDMIEHQIGSLAVTRLDLVAEALQRYWQRTLQSLRNDSSLKHESPYDLCYTFNLWHNSRDEYYGSGGFGSPKPPVGDPMFVPEVSALLQEQPQFSFRQQAAKGNALCLLTRRYALPLEIKYLIAGHLGIEDVCNMLLAFGEEFPVNYWRQQAHGDIIFELDSVDPDRLPFLAREIIKRGLLQEVEGLQFRQRLIETLVPIKQDILEMSASDYGDGGKGTGFGG